MASDGAVGLIELRLHDLGQLFNSFDPSPFRERDLDTDAEDYIVGWARELPRHVTLGIVIHLPETELAKARDRDLPLALANYFGERARFEQLELRELFRNGRRYLLIGLPLLLVCLFASQAARTWLGDGPLYRTLQESLVIVGWVANWRPIQTFLYDWLPIVRRRDLYRRLAAAKVEVTGD